MGDVRIAFVGGGNMTRAIVGGLLDDGYNAQDIFVAEPMDRSRATLSRDLPGIHVSDDNAAVARNAQSIVLAVKPQVLPEVCKQLATTVQETRPLILSVAAGVRSADIDRWLGGNLAIIRVMPNQPALLRAGISGVYANEATTDAQRITANNILSAIGPVVSVPRESDIDAVTAISGSGPAYFYLLIDMLAKTGAELGLDEAVALELAVETAKGAAKLADGSHESMDALIQVVRSPGGTTAAALDSLESLGIRDIFSVALTAARDKAIELADQAAKSSQG